MMCFIDRPKMHLVSNPKFIVIEGLDLTGKSTIVKRLKECNPEFIFTREPGGVDCELAESIRELILSYPDVMDAKTEAYLFAASRSAHMKKIKEWMEAGNTIVCDRFLYSSIYYQGIMKKLGPEVIKQVNSLAIGDFKPDLIIYVTASEAERNRRANARKDEFNQLDKQSIEQNYVLANIEYFNSIKDSCDCPIRIVDTTDNDIDRCVKEVRDSIESLCTPQQ